ncbi:MAG: LysE family translocator [Hoeflea sp.]|nr:LysE family translocator [Alphaproteobacteria bacterium]MBV1725799.1 LysE family translocator [Hoeflea sp.]MBU4543766.1 LysE family translocator [Alphaproteobacteria bacterium]MBU4548633.1 LysE family translocator [Alphaproteobacteria bacterium]MBV1762155.1 LysE family translocator [Hoeflea sp.]
MFEHINYTLIITAAFLGAGSPGPSTLAIAGTAMAHGRGQALALVAGISSGSWIWSIAAALGLSALMFANAWVFELLRYLGAGYLLFLAYRSARSALSPTRTQLRSVTARSHRSAYGKGLAMHLTNPKAILFFGALYSVGVPVTATRWEIASVVLLVGLQSMGIFIAYAVLFSNPRVVGVYIRLRRWFEGAFAVAFGFAGLKLLTARL